MALREGTGAARVAVRPAATFAYLADPRNAPEWFAGAAFAQAPEGPPRQGMTWSVVQRQSSGRVAPVAMSVYEPPSRFVWRTQLRWPRTNLVWEMRCAPTEDEGTGLTFTIRIEPGPLGWLTLLAAAPFSRGAVARRAQRAVDRACAALLERSTLRERRPPAVSRDSKAARRRRKPRKGRN